MTGIILILSISIAALGLIVFFNFAPQLGDKARGERLERMQSTTNYRNGKFYNTIPTGMNMKPGKMLGVMWKFIFKKKGREPISAFHVKTFKTEYFLNSDPNHLFFSWFGHSSLLVRIDGKILLLDPVFSERASMFTFMGPKRFPYTHYMDTDQLPPVDAVIISHDHYDHLDYKVIRKLADRVPAFYVPLSVGAHLEKWGVPSERIIEIAWWETTQLDSLTFVFTPSRHFSGRGLNNRFTTLWGSWVIVGKKERLFFGGDSGYFPGFKEIGEKFGPFDLTFLECGAYNENWADIHMMPEETVQANIDLKGNILMPIHWGKFSLALHPWKEPVERALKRSRELNVNMITPEIGRIMKLENKMVTPLWWQNYQ